MKKKSKVILTILSVLATIFISFVVGINLGFSDGYSLSTNISTSSDAFYFAHTLKSLREGKIEDAINLMEIKLDTSIIEHKFSKKPSFAFFFVPLSHIFEFDDRKDLSLFKQVIAYRNQYHSTGRDEEIRNAVHSYLDKIETELTKTDITSHSLTGHP